MHFLMQLTETATLLDALAIVSSLLILLFLMRNRRQYGSLVIDGNQMKAMAGFSDEVSLQMMSQQSIMAYANLKRSLTQEFESLWMLGDSASLPGGHQSRRRCHGPTGSIDGANSIAASPPAVSTSRENAC
jgi:hypothetical protein